MSNFVNLHAHTEGSPLDGLASSAQYARRAKELGQTALAITDHGQLGQLPEHYRECKEAGISPILGIEQYFAVEVDRAAKKRPEYNHLVVLAKGEPGYRTLCKLSTAAHGNFYYVPVVQPNMLLDLDDELENLIILSGCLAGPLARIAQKPNCEDELLTEMRWWQKNIPHFYVEIQDHKTDIDKVVTTKLVKAARKLGVPWVPSTDSHFCMEDEAGYHDVLLAVAMGKEIDDMDRMRFDGEGFWLMSDEEMQQAFSRYPSWVYEQGAANSVEIAEMCETTIPEWETKSWVIPDLPGVNNPNARIQKICLERLADLGLDENRDYISRMKMEFRVIKQTGVAPFLLIARDAVIHAQSQGIRVGAGRGSVGASLICYLLQIHKVDPVKYRLRFDRFLNPERPRMPDIDIDFQASRRDEMFEYVKEKYGEDNVINVATFLRLRLKSVWRTLAKAHGIPFAEQVKVSEEMVDSDDEADIIPKLILERYPEIADTMRALLNIKRGFGSHPAGVVIAPESYKLAEKIPKMWLSSSKRWVAQYDLAICEMMGLLKQDFLGISNLDSIDQCIAMRRKIVDMAEGRNSRWVQLDDEIDLLDPDSWDPDEMPWDKDVYKELAAGKTAGIFQLSGPSNAKGCREVKPKCFEDIVVILALYRKGPMQSGMTNTYLKNRSTGEIDYLHPDLEPILAETYGTIIFQEQILDISEAIAGFGPGEADDLLRAVAKKKADLMLSIKPSFLKGCKTHGGMLPEDADKLWQNIEHSAAYVFNRAHSVGYALLAYQMACLRHLYPLEFYCSLLRTVPDDKEGRPKRMEFMKAVVAGGYKMLPPHVNRSGAHAMPDHDGGGIRFGLVDIKGIGEKMANRLIRNRPDGGFWETAQVEGVVRNSKAHKALVRAGALGCLGERGTVKGAEELLGWTFIDRMAPYRPRFVANYRPPHVVFGEIVSTRTSKTKKGDPFCTWVVRWDPSTEWTVKIWSSAKKLHSVPKGAIVRCSGKWQGDWRNQSVTDVGDVKVIALKPEKKVTA